MCQLFCGDSGTLWPKPTGHYSINSQTVHLNPEKIKISEIKSNTHIGHLLQRNVDKLKENVQSLSRGKTQIEGEALNINFVIKSNYISRTLETNENYTLHITQNENGKVNIQLKKSL